MAATLIMYVINFQENLLTHPGIFFAGLISPRALCIEAASREEGLNYRSVCCREGECIIFIVLVVNA